MLKLGDCGLRRIATEMRRVSQCEGKRRHRSRGAAEAAMRSLIARRLHRPEDGNLNVYLCRRCLTWHVGHTDRRENRNGGDSIHA